MSGRKRIQVDESEWYRMQRKAQKLKEVLSTLPGLIDDVRAQTRADIDRTFAAVEERRRRQDQVIQNLSAQTRQLEADTSRRLQEQARELRGALDETAGRIRAETRQRLAEHQEAVLREISAERTERRAEMARLSEGIEKQEEDRAQAEQTVRSWLADGRTMAALIAETLPHERYAPGELDPLTSRLTTAENNAAAGRFDAGLAVAQEAYHSLSELRVDIEQRELERCSAQTAAVEALVRIEKLIEGNKERPVIGPDGAALPGYKLDVVYWADGELDELRETTAQALSRARDDRSDADELRGLREQATGLESALEDVVERAGMRQLASQIRVNLADAVAHTLGDYAYYDLVDGEYQDADPRGAYYAKLRHDNGNEIVLDISQAQRDSGECVIRVHSYDYDTTSEADLAARARAIGEGLETQGHQVSAPVSEKGVPDEDLRRRVGQPRAGGPESASESASESRPGTA
ncbi:hypothetical protein [Streptomyces sp. NPDC051183]|uniref:hypothetical protein n=1 Tax=Streptomyces sp. NPDC051183 TaxID=3155165 RepID=UPI00342DDFDB